MPNGTDFSQFDFPGTPRPGAQLITQQIRFRGGGFRRLGQAFSFARQLEAAGARRLRDGAFDIRQLGRGFRRKLGLPEAATQLRLGRALPGFKGFDAKALIPGPQPRERRGFRETRIVQRRRLPATRDIGTVLGSGTGGGKTLLGE